jgi:hypothetical protein
MSNQKNLNLNPLSIVKFFYERLGKKAIEQPFIHPALYLAYQEIQKKENIVLFREKFTSAETTPVLPSVYNYLEKKSKLTFRQIPDVTNEAVAYYLENICRRYQRKYENEKLELFTCDLQFRAQKLAGNI